MSSHLARLEGLSIDLRGRTSGQIKTLCPKCTPTRKNKKNRSLSVNIDEGVYKCWNSPCDFSGHVGERGDLKNHYNVPELEHASEIDEELRNVLHGWGINNDAIMALGFQLYEGRGGVKWLEMPYYDGKQLTYLKHRRITGGKAFRAEANCKQILYNLNNIRGESEIIWVEGEKTAAVVMSAGFRNVTCLPNGAGDSLEAIGNCYEDIKDAKVHLIFTDDDEAGRKLKEKLLNRLGRDKCKEVKAYQGCNDGDAMVAQFGIQEGYQAIRDAIETAEFPPVEGVHYLDNYWDQMIHEYHNGTPKGMSMGIDVLEKSISFMLGKTYVITGIPNHGKSEWLKYILLLMSLKYGYKWGYFGPEDFPCTEFYRSLMRMYIGKGTDKNGVYPAMTEEEYIEAMEFVGEHFFYVYPEKSQSWDALIEKQKELVVKHGINGFIYDPVNMMDKVEKGMRDDERISYYLTLTGQLAKFHNVANIYVVHPLGSKLFREKDGTGYRPPMAYDLESGSMWFNKCDGWGVTIHRPGFWTNKDSPEVLIQPWKVKNRQALGSGEDAILNYDRAKFRYVRPDGYDFIKKAREEREHG